MNQPDRGRIRLRVVIVTIATLLAAVLVVSHATRSRPVPHLPVLGPAHDVFDGDIGDPFVLPVPGAGYWVFGTNDWPAHVPTGFSTDLTHWTRGPDAMPSLPTWAAPDPTSSLVWAPTVIAIDGTYLMYVTVPDAASGRECIAVEASDTPAGPYRAIGTGPLVCQASLGGSIDPMVVRDPGGPLHLLWKNDGNCCGITVWLWAQDLTPDGRSLLGTPHRLLAADQAWEAGVIERPAVLPAARGGWWLFHAGNNWQLAAYGTGLAYCKTLAGPCRNATRGPYLATRGTAYSPGGLSVFTDLHNTQWVVFATWNRPPRNGRFYCCRSVELAPVLSN